MAQITVSEVTIDAGTSGAYLIPATSRAYRVDVLAEVSIGTADFYLQEVPPSGVANAMELDSKTGVSRWLFFHARGKKDSTMRLYYENAGDAAYVVTLRITITEKT